jgi:lysophospholipase L1-like esterase
MSHGVADGYDESLFLPEVMMRRLIPLRRIAWLVALSFILPLCSQGARAAVPDPTPFEKQVTIMPLGDSITEGGSTFSCYRAPLWEKLFAAGYLIDYVGSRTSPSRFGPFRHEGYGGKSTEYLAANIERLYKAHPADVVLLHSGHNHAVEEKPVPGILAATEKIVTTIHSIRPDATVLVAQVIPSGKLPKYSYHPELNAALAQLVERLKQSGQRVALVKQTEGFDWHTDTVADHVHPNARGAEKMAARWF